jgi:hypothetical protein
MIGFGFNDLRLSIVWKPLRFLLLSKEGKRRGDFFPTVEISPNLVAHMVSRWFVFKPKISI